MRPTLDELLRFMDELGDAVTGSVIEKVWRPTKTALLLEIRGLKQLADTGRRPRLYLDLEHGAPWVAVTTRWPDTPSAPDRETLELRRHLEHHKIIAVALEDNRRLHLALLGGTALIVQLAGRYPQLGVSAEDGTTLCTLLPTRALRDTDSPALKPGPAPDLPAPWLLHHGERAWALHDQRALVRRRLDLATATRRALARAKRLHDSLAEDLARTEHRHELARQADLLVGALHLVRDKATSVEATDWTQDPPQPVTIALDPALSGPGNLERLHARKKKLERQREALEPQLANATTVQEQLTALLAELAPEDLDDAALDLLEARLAALDEPKRPAASRAPGAAREAARLPYRAFVAADGSEILVGRSARDNDALTFKVARGADIFLHARDVPGSHVILCHRKKGPPHPEALMDAAALAAWHSGLREDTVVDVLWTEKKHVRKVKGSPGLVQTAATRNLAVRRDPARIERLYRSVADAPARRS